ncbi:glycoside hydrolase family 16 protein [Parathielavia hyrcaniae]|uniref:Crh-like protein n=1 Tax=Parathielavia hyrcaniae TaxID=113614 RepID=A0AAN6Q445_9PEZI|nr:glycoside hydrolase family 16 protein [Parathielavia hyrcaniae]
MLFKLLTSAAFAASLVSAQTHTACDPTKRDDCPNPKAVGSKPVDIDFRKGESDFFTLADGTSLTYDDQLGAVFSISKEGQAPTVGSNAYIFFGQVDVTVRAARGVGVVTSFVLQSDDLDEVDWEWLGGDNAQVQTNYFSKGCVETYDRGGFSPVADPVNQFHTYTIKWTPTQLDWIIDGTVVRSLQNSGLSGCAGYPQSPMQIKLGTWVAGRKDAPQGTIDWAGGITDFSDGPFDGYYQSLRVVDYMGAQGATEATEYHYTDLSGSWQSIKVVNDGEEADSSSSATTKSSSATSKPSSSAATTLTTVSASQSASSNGTITTSSTVSPTGTSDDDQASATTTGSTSLSTAAAPTMVGNMAAVGAAALLGYLAL